MLRLVLASCCIAFPVAADTVFATRTIRAHSIITAQDLVVKPSNTIGAATKADQLVGFEARVALYAGRPISLSDVGTPAVIERNQIVPLVFNQNGLRISTEGRSLARGGEGDYVRVMNLSSRTTVSGRVMPDGRVMVSE